MLYCSPTLLLAVVAFGVVAHGKTLPLTAKDNVTSLFAQGVGAHGAVSTEAAATAMATSGHNLRNLDKTKDERRTSSAVQDWSLVCEQLCGAALGGAACTPYCGNVSQSSLKVQIANADILMASQKNYICPKLCGLQLGDAVCTCTNWNAGDYRSLQRSKEEETNVCAIFCDYKHVTLAGCSPCGKINLNDNVITPEYNVLAVKALNKSVAVDEVDSVQPIGTATATTPDWNQLCAALCKTGDGGSLCNCGLSPFML